MSYKITETVGDVSITYEAPTMDEALKMVKHGKESSTINNEISVTLNCPIDKVVFDTEDLLWKPIADPRYIYGDVK